ncbi:MAG TPA: acyl-CoA dehydrogenase family protein [Blastocatellia bacterium]|nr:acyl-CoA dehydrogenase family protein [Blastocatellia bacterium]
MARLEDFRGIEGTNFFEQDKGFQTLIGGLLPDDERQQVFASLQECGSKVAGRWDELAREASRNENLPRIIKLDRTGLPVEKIDFGPLTRELRREVAELGVLTRARSELHKFALVYLLAHNGEASVMCGMSCTDGLIRSIEARGSQFLRETYLPLLGSTETPLAGAQFVTEKDGGSDVGAITTEATPNADGAWSVTGRKWFCSNPDEYFAVAARPAGAQSGTAGLGLFMVPRVLPDGRLNSLRYRRLKDKLGTRSLPTAEIDFEGATAYAIGEVGDGFKTLMNYVINASRLHNAANACGFLHRAFLEARNYARQREAFSQPIINYPLIQETLVTLLERSWRGRVLTFRLIASVDQNSIAPSDAGQAMWQRFLTNLAKYRTARDLMDSIRQAILVLGGNGIVEDFTVLPRLLRDALIIETWEGPPNTLCMQVVRDCARSPLFDRWRSEINNALERWPTDFLALTRARVERAFNQTVDALSEDRLRDQEWAATHARRVVDSFGSLLELTWMADLAMRHVESDSTAGLLTAAAAQNTLPADNAFDSPVIEAIRDNAQALIAEEEARCDLSRL